MQFIELEESPENKNHMAMEHNGRILMWNVRTYRHLPKGDNLDKLVLDINKFWAAKSQQEQQQIFNIYDQMHLVLEETDNTRVLDQKLSDLFAELFKHHNFNDIMTYFYNSDITYPEDKLKEECGTLVPALTYLKNDYQELLGLVLLLKVALPVWGSYIAAVAGELKKVSVAFKEYRAAGLIHKSNVIHCSAYIRLYKYVTEYWNGYTKQHSTAAVIKGIDRYQVPEWLMGQVLTRRIANWPLTHVGDTGESKIIVASIYNFIEHNVSTMDKNFDGRISNKALEHTNPGGEDDNTSVIENYKIKQEVSEGILKTHEVFLMNHPREILKRIDPTCPYEGLNRVRIDFNKNFPGDFEIDELRLSIVQWVLDPVVSARALKEMCFDAVITGYHIAYTLLRHWGFNHISMLLYAQKTLSNKISGAIRQPISEAQLTRLCEIYPYSPKMRKRKSTKRETNVAVTAIAHVLNNSYGAWWRLAPWESPEDYPKLSMDRDLAPLPYDIEPQLADMIIYTRGGLHKKLYKNGK